MPVAILAPLTVPPPPASPFGSRTAVVAFAADHASCADGPVAIDRSARPMSVLVTRYDAVDAAPPLPTFRFTFAIDAQGHAASIRRDPVPPFGFYIDTSDLAPALAASRFAAGMPHTGCSIRYTASLTPIDAAPLSTLYELASRPEPGGLVAAVNARLRPAGSTCPTEPGRYRRLNMPAFETLPPPPGGSAWVFLAFDVDRAGRPHGARVLGTSGDAALDRAGLRAVSENRYAPGRGYAGCTYHFYHNAPPDLPSPTLPTDAPADNGEQPGCAMEPRSIAGLLNGSAYPRPFSRRRIEGVAVVSFDTAPWGAIGNVKILAAEPDEAFGEAARDGILNARVPPSDTGRSGCVRHVRFRLPPMRNAW